MSDEQLVKVLVHPTAEALSDAIAARTITALIDVIGATGRADICLTGGSLGSQMIASLVANPASAAVAWERVVVWWGDERYLASGDPDRNQTQNEQAGLGSLGILPANIHPMLGPDQSDSAEASAQAYAKTLEQFGPQLFDIVFLGVGPDGHVASLFPSHPEATTSGVPTIAVHNSPKPPPTRVSLTFERLNAAARVWFIVAGAEKSEAVGRGIGAADPVTTPASAVHGRDQTLWLVDRDAASAVG